MPNPNGYPTSLEPLREANVFAVKSGIYSRTGRVLAPRAEEIAEALMTLPHVTGVDAIAAEEIGSVLAALEAIDRDLGERGPTLRGSGRRSLLEHKARLSRELKGWLREFGATPAARADWAARLASGGLVAEIARGRVSRSQFNE